MDCLKKIAEEVDTSLTGEDFDGTSNANNSAFLENKATLGEGLNYIHRCISARYKFSNRVHYFNLLCVLTLKNLHQDGVTFGAHEDFPYERTSLSSFSQVSQQYESYNSSTSMGVPANHRMFNQPFQLTQSSQAVPTSMTKLLQAPLSQPLDEDIWFNS
ncbi:uncharacterized protein LOC131323941 [Rhododendron vialii]|uniref:uncharacterized protein LOC131323941 n=1 Tax=Rhododendron vialii TaxID=182163 RepID=UPI00265FE5AC|nr:uncharacterized protein LOC131323941 [Rhododendron vialii]